MTSSYLLSALAMTTLLVHAEQLTAKPVTEKQDRIELDWANMKIRFFGEAQAGTSADGYRAAEQTAWQEGIAYIAMNLNKLRTEHLPGGDDAQADKAALREVSSSSYSVNTTYFANGKIRVHLENSLPKALQPGNVPFKALRAEAQPTRNTGLIIQVKGKTRPMPVYKVVTDQGQAVFEVMDVAKESFEKNFMGAWYEMPSTEEMRPVVGKNPVTVDARLGPEGTLQVSHKQWTSALAGNEGILRQARVAIALK